VSFRVGKWIPSIWVNFRVWFSKGSGFFCGVGVDSGQRPFSMDNCSVADCTMTNEQRRGWLIGRLARMDRKARMGCQARMNRTTEPEEARGLPTLGNLRSPNETHVRPAATQPGRPDLIFAKYHFLPYTTLFRNTLS